MTPEVTTDETITSVINHITPPQVGCGSSPGLSILCVLFIQSLFTDLFTFLPSLDFLLQTRFFSLKDLFPHR